MRSLNPAYKKHVFICTNDRQEQSRDACGKVGGFEIFRALKNWVREEGLTSQIWVTRTGCLGFCNPVGTTIVIYPDKKWFLEVTLSDLDKIKNEIWKRVD